ncbi:Uncharacterised protein [[Clostridium] sordellii]|uniref:Uncharacterized protein n=1 Tax=Terrisporobacter glycolicus ATCC 14880 = DSM 1288 TaxID=1121315 RepID=A0ABZ2F1S6_9FIRM|nr:MULTISPECIES: hypothetical protein [Peptostreptococcaceae]CEQ26778.1 Uncharacterised protein [[Clostridium] sordellii] [Paeniclostridium sordellii]
MKCIISFKELYGKELEKYEVEGKHSGDVLQAMENKLCSEIEPYNTYSLKNCKNIDKKASKKTLHFKDNEGNILSYVMEILDVRYLKKSI